MFNLLIHTALLILVFYLLGCFVGWLLRGLFAGGSSAKSDRPHGGAEPTVVAPRPAAALAAGAGVEPTILQPALAAVRPFAWTATHAGGRLTLAGHVPNEATRADLLTQARKLFPGKAIDDHLRLGGGAPLGFGAATGHCLSQLAKLNSGRAMLSDTALTLTGEAPHAMARDAVRSATLPAGYRAEALTISVADSYAGGTAPTRLALAPVAVTAPAAIEPTVSPVVAASPSAEAASLPVVKPYRWQAALADNVLTLSGHVSGDRDRQRLRTVAQAALPDVKLIDNSHLGAGAPENFDASAVEGLKLLSGLKSGKLMFTDGALELAGEAKGGLELLKLRKAIADLPPSVTLAGHAVTQAYGAEPSVLTSSGIAVDAATAAAIGAAGAAAGSAGSATTSAFVSADAPTSATTAVASAVAASGPIAATAVLPKVSPYRWNASHDGATVTLTGYCPDDATQAAIAAGIKAVLPNAIIRDRTLLAAGAPAEFSQTATTAAGLLGSLGRGSISLEGDEISFVGEARSGLDLLSFRKGLATLPGSNKIGANRVTQSFGAVSADASSAALTSTGVAVEPPRLASAVSPAESGAAASPAEMPLPAGDADGSKSAAANAVGDRPIALAQARGDRADDLKRVRGIGPQNEARLHLLGIWHFDQIAAWTPANARWVGAYLSFPGRIEREDWIEQARVLAQGGETDFSARVGRGEVAYQKIVDLGTEAKAIADRFVDDDINMPQVIPPKS